MQKYSELRLAEALEGRPFKIRSKFGRLKDSEAFWELFLTDKGFTWKYKDKTSYTQIGTRLNFEKHYSLKLLKIENNTWKCLDKSAHQILKYIVFEVHVHLYLKKMIFDKT